MPPVIRSASDMEALVQDYGFLPFFRCEIPGFSVEDLTAPECWFVDGVESPWDWKGPVAQTKTCAYGKFFRNRAGFVSLAWLPDFINLRRGGMTMEKRYELGLVSHKDKRLYELVRDNGSLTTKAIKWMGGYGRDGVKGFDASVTRLQMHTDLLVEDFEYTIDRHGAPYGWGIARYSTPERWLGELLTPVSEPPETSRRRIMERLSALLPSADERQLTRLLKG